MFYLLEDNRIFDSEKDKVEISEEGGVKFLRNEYGYKLGEITKQSENVFDLIEKGDLLEIKQPKESGEKYTFGEYKEQEITNYASYIKEAFPNKILAIYKPNANGDYIKVWERKEE